MLIEAPPTLKPSPGQVVTLWAVWHLDYGLSWAEDDNKFSSELYVTQGQAWARLFHIGWDDDGGAVFPVTFRVPEELREGGE